MGSSPVAVAKQLSLFLENKPGVLARLAGSLAAEKINILAMSISDTVDHAVVRLLVSDPQKAVYLFEQHGTLVVENEVMTLRLPNRPGTLAEVCEKLARAKINIEYAYGSVPPKGAGTLVLRVHNLKKARQVLEA